MSNCTCEACLQRRWPHLSVLERELLAALKGMDIPNYPLSDCAANQKYIVAQRVVAKAEGREVPDA